MSIDTFQKILTERARIMARRKELYEEKHPETKNGGDRVSTRRKIFPSGQTEAEGFAVATAAAIGKNERIVRFDVQRGTEITDEALDLITRTPLDNTKYLNDLMRSPKTEQVERVKRDLASPPRRSRTRPDPDAAYRARIEVGPRWHAVAATCLRELYHLRWRPPSS